MCDKEQSTASAKSGILVSVQVKCQVPRRIFSARDTRWIQMRSPSQVACCSYVPTTDREKIHPNCLSAIKYKTKQSVRLHIIRVSFHLHGRAFWFDLNLCGINLFDFKNFDISIFDSIVRKISILLFRSSIIVIKITFSVHCSKHAKKFASATSNLLNFVLNCSLAESRLKYYFLAKHDYCNHDTINTKHPLRWKCFGF